MNSSETLPSFANVIAALEQIGAQTNAAETHGILCGFICAGNYMDGKSWIEPILGKQHNGNNTNTANRDLLLDLYQISSQKLQGIEFDFQLLLPDDDTPLRERAEALTYWCQGFIIGLDFAGIDIQQGVSEDSREALNHILEISKLDYNALDVNEADEKAFTEVYEYVRIAAIMIYSEIADNHKGGHVVH